MESTRVQFVPGKTRVVTTTVVVPQQQIVYKTETVPYYITRTVQKLEQVTVTRTNLIAYTVRSTRLRYATDYQQEVKQSVVQVPIKSTSYVERLVTSVVPVPGNTRIVYRTSTVLRTIPGPGVVKTSVVTSTEIQNRFITVTTTSTQIEERLKTKLIKDCGGYKYKQPSVGLGFNF